MTLTNITQFELESYEPSKVVNSLVNEIMQGHDEMLDDLQKVFSNNSERVIKEYLEMIKSFQINMLPKKTRDSIGKLLKTTLNAIGIPPYFRFLLDPENGKLAVEKCSYKSSGAHQLPEDTSHDGYELKSMDMVRFICQTCGWDMKSTYRIRGIAVPDRDMVVFDLTTAYRVQEGHLVG